MMGEGSKIPDGRPDHLAICDRAEAIRLVFQVLRRRGTAEARDLLNDAYPFTAVAFRKRTYGVIGS
jgi:hypothetical protein